MIKNGVAKVSKFLSFWVSGVVLALLLGCTPEFNWRELSMADDRVTLAFPAKVLTEQRQLQIDDHKLLFSLSAASVGSAVFAVGYAPLPQGLNAAQELSLKRALLGSLFSPSGQEVSQVALEGRVFELDTVVAKQPSLLVARVFIHRGMLIQVVASGPRNALPREQALEFMQSLVLK